MAESTRNTDYDIFFIIIFNSDFIIFFNFNSLLCYVYSNWLVYYYLKPDKAVNISNNINHEFLFRFDFGLLDLLLNCQLSHLV